MTVDTIPDVGLETLFSNALPPCLVRIVNGIAYTTRTPCGNPPIALVRARCASCGLVDTFGICRPHREIFRRHVAVRPDSHADCDRCGSPGTIVMIGL